MKIRKVIARNNKSGYNRNMQSLQEFMLPFYKKISFSNQASLKNKTILITGASGLIGANIISFLDYLNDTKNLKMKIIAVTRSNRPKWLETSSAVRYIKIDLSKDIKKLDIPFDFLIHGATYAGVRGLENIEETVVLNTEKFIKLLSYAKKNNARVLFISSSEIYGNPAKGKTIMDETYFGNVNTLSQRAIYAEAKRLAEAICFAYKDSIKIKIARALIAYGPGVKGDDKRVIPEFIKKAQKTKNIQMIDNGTATRTICFISDILEMMLNILLNGQEFVYNVSGKGQITIAELAEQIAKINNAKVIFPKTINTISGTVLSSVISNKKYCNEFKKLKFIPLEEGLKITSQWILNINNEN